MKFVGLCAIYEVEFPAPPDRSMHLGSYIGVFDDPPKGLRYKSDVDRGPSVPVSIDAHRHGCRSTSIAYQSTRKCVKIFLMEAPPRYQISQGEEEEEKKDQEQSSIIIDYSVLRWC